MKLLGQYINGNYSVKVFSDGTKIRETSADKFIPSFPESMDISITDRCDKRCGFCYAGATPDGKHGDILGAKFIDTLRPFTEVALNGNDLSHPDLIKFLDKLKKKDIIASMTVNQTHFMKHQPLITLLIGANLIKGLGVSLVNPTDEFIDKIKQFPNAVIHVVNGIVGIDQLERLYDNNLKILILGYKTVGRGLDYYSDEVEERKQILYCNIEDIIPRFKIVSFDNLAIEQLDIQETMSKEKWDEFYMGDDGSMSLFIDLPKGYFSKNSLSEVKYDLLDNIDDMFKVVVNEQ